MSTLDLNDPMVRAMADRNHEPEELWALDGSLVSVGCRQCYHPWPCPTRQALDARCTCPDIDTTLPNELPGSNTVKGLDPRCPQHGADQ